MARPKGSGMQVGQMARGSRRRVARTEADIHEHRAKHGELPLAYLLRQLRDKELPREQRFAAAVAAAPYVHPRLQAVDSRSVVELHAIGGIDAPPRTITETREEWLDRRRAELDALANTAPVLTPRSKTDGSAD